MNHNEITRDIIGGNAIDHAVAYSTDIVGKECIGCMNALPYNRFRADASFRDGRRDMCVDCEASPRLSTVEHTHRLRERNFNHEGVKRQRWEHQEEYKNAVARVGKAMHHSAFINIVQRLVPCLYITDGRFEGDMAVFRTYGQPQPHLATAEFPSGRDFEYLFYIPKGILPEFSQYEFDEVRDVPIRESKRGWRTVLLRLIKSGLLNEDACNQVFGRPEGVASTVWHRQLWTFRNNKGA